MQTPSVTNTMLTGLVLSIRTLAAAVSIVAVNSCALGSPHSDRMRDEAVDWATNHRPSVFDRLMPAAEREDVRHPVCRITTLRSPGAVDRYEFALRIEEHCDDGHVTGEFIVPRGAPLTVQLAILRIQNPTISRDESVGQLSIDRRALPSDTASKILRILQDNELSPVASDELVVDRRRFEMTSASWTFVRVEFLDIEHRRGWKRLPAAVRSILAMVGTAEKALEYDPSGLEP